MKRFGVAGAIVLSLLWLGVAWGQYGGDETGMSGCGAGGTPIGPEVPGGCGNGVPQSNSTYVPPPSCTGAINLSTGCAQPMLGGL